MNNKKTDIGIVRSLDDIGRLMIPIEARREIGLTPGSMVHMYVDDGKVIVEKYIKTCYICGRGANSFYTVNEKRICDDCRIAIANIGVVKD